MATLQSESQAAENAASDSKIKYQGRKTSRAGSEQRRRLILEAALRIVVKEGVRGIRHRAVAKEADVPLAATTYYFKDIQELINDTFTLYAEKAMTVVNEFTQKLYQPIKSISDLTSTNVIENERLIEKIAEFLTEYIINQVMENRDSLIAEQAFRYEAILNPDIRHLAALHDNILNLKLIDFLKLFRSDMPDADARIILAMIHRIEYECLVSEGGHIPRDEIQAAFKRQISLLGIAMVQSAQAQSQP